jgi:endogenous inhibitor of DNA gyrase (YacG/DUF329 family)
MVDLGAWFAEERRLPGDAVDELQARDDLPKA